MSEKRQHKRNRRRLNVKFGEKLLSNNGFTVDVSNGGIFLVTSQLLRLRTRLHLQLWLDAESHVYFEGEVRRHKIVPPELRSIEKNGLGIRFLPPAEIVRGMMGQTGAPRLGVHFTSQAELAAAFERELKHGGVFVHTDEELARDTRVVLDVNLDFAHRSLEIDGTVVHISTTDPVGLGVVFADRNAVASLRTFLAP